MKKSRVYYDTSEAITEGKGITCIDCEVKKNYCKECGNFKGRFNLLARNEAIRDKKSE